MSNPIAPVTDASLKAFIDGVQVKMNEDWKRHGITVLDVPTIEYEMGPKNIRVIKTKYTKDGKVLSRSVHCFIERATGTIMKAGGWKAPVKGNRGSINSPGHGMEYVTHHGVHYLR